MPLLTRLAGGWRLAPILTATLALWIGLSACSSSEKATGSTGYLTGETVITTIEPAERKQAPPLAGGTLEGGSVDLTDYRGQVVVLNVWAHWCPPCRAEADDLVAAHDTLDDAAFVGLNTNEDSKTAAQAFVRTNDIPYESLYDDDGSMILEFEGLLTPNSLPSTLIIDPDGRIAALVLGELTTSTLVGLVEDVQSEA
ncbi:MAG: TlpA family protein disulfide reductase [Actinomycetota bacterium]|nr:TlpA family protein disulfide reductase [Actinomycetota bacterium]